MAAQREREKAGSGGKERGEDSLTSRHFQYYHYQWCIFVLTDKIFDPHVYCALLFVETIEILILLQRLYSHLSCDNCIRRYSIMHNMCLAL